MRFITSVIPLCAVAFALFLLSGCEDEPVTTLSVTFPRPTIDLSGLWTERTVTLKPSFNIDSSKIIDAQWRVFHITGYLEPDPEAAGEFLNEEPPVESVTFGGQSFIEAVVSFEYQGVYIIELEVEDDTGRKGIGQVQIQVGDGSDVPGGGYMPWGPSDA